MDINIMFNRLEPNRHEVFDVQPSATIKVPGWLGPLGGRANSLEIQDEQICRLSFS